jgi:hypothetical protein
VTAEPQILSVYRAGHEQPCRRCGDTIRLGQRAALLTDVGAVHVRCLIVRQEDTVTRHDQEPSTSATVRLPRPTVADDGDQDAAGPSTERPAATSARPDLTHAVEDVDADPRSVDWWQW